MHTAKPLAIVAAIALAGAVGFAQGRGHGGRPGTPPGQSGAAPHGPKAGHGRPETAGKPANAGKPHGPKTIPEHLATQPQLRGRIQTLLPGMDLDRASAGFKNMGQFVAAANVSHDLNIPFDALKTRMTGDPAMSLGQAIHELKPDADAKVVTERAEKKAREMIGGTDRK
jgi:hypothetical protein